MRPTSPVLLIRSRYNVAEVHSKRQRSPREAEIIVELGHRVRIYELQGHLNFASLESFSRDMVEQAEESDLLAIDFKRVLRMDLGGIALFEELVDALLAAGKRVALADAEHVGGLGDRVAALAREHAAVHLAENLDWAIEWCEDQLIADLDPDIAPPAEVALADNEFFLGLDLGTVEKADRPGSTRRIRRGRHPHRSGDSGDANIPPASRRGQRDNRLAVSGARAPCHALRRHGLRSYGAPGHEPPGGGLPHGHRRRVLHAAIEDVMAVAQSDPELLAAVYRASGRASPPNC